MARVLVLQGQLEEIEVGPVPSEAQAGGAGRAPILMAGCRRSRLPSVLSAWSPAVLRVMLNRYLFRPVPCRLARRPATTAGRPETETGPLNLSYTPTVWNSSDCPEATSSCGR